MHFRDAIIYNPRALNYRSFFKRNQCWELKPIWNFTGMQRKGLGQKPTDFQKKVMATSMLHTSLLKPNTRQHFRAHKEILKALLAGQEFMRTAPGECLSDLMEGQQCKGWISKPLGHILQEAKRRDVSRKLEVLSGGRRQESVIWTGTKWNGVGREKLGHLHTWRTKLFAHQSQRGYWILIF